MHMKALVMSWEQLSYTFIENGRRQVFHLVPHNVFRLFVTPHTLAGQTFLDMQVITWCNFGTVWRIVENSPLEQFSRPLLYSSRKLVLPLKSRHHFLTFPFFISHSPYTSKICLCISAGRKFLEFKNLVTDHTFQMAGFSIFGFIFNDYREWEKK
jgi:hypothetical protein